MVDWIHSAKDAYVWEERFYQYDETSERFWRDWVRTTFSKPKGSERTDMAIAVATHI